MRWGIGLAGLFSAMGFAYCGYAYGYAFPYPNSLYWCAAFSLLIVVACLGGLVGNIAQRVIGAAVCLAYIAYFVYELTQPDGKLVSGRRSGTTALNALAGLIFFGVPAGGWAIFGGKFYMQEKLWEAGLADMTKLEEAMQEARESGLVYCRWFDGGDIGAPEEYLEHLAVIDGALPFAATDGATARSFAETILEKDLDDGYVRLDGSAAKSLVREFWNEARADREGAAFWTAHDGTKAAVVVHSDEQWAILLVDDESFEEEESPGTLGT